jgi:branched-chain amino acid transport system substrate-binding protein
MMPRTFDMPGPRVRAPPVQSQWRRDNRMQKYMRWSAILAVLVLVLAACQNGGGGTDPSPGDNGNGNGNGDGGAAEQCDADEFGCVEVAEGEPIILGTALVISGPNSTLGLDTQYGAQVAAELRNEEGGVLGRQIEFDFQDDGCSAEGGTAAARALVSNPQVVAVIGTSCSSAGVPAAEITSEAGYTMVSPSNTAPSLTAEDTHQPFSARTAHNDSVQGAAMAEYACTELGAESAATIHDGSPYAEQLQQVFADEFQEQCGGTITVQEAITVGQTDFSALLESIGADAPDLLYYPIFVAEAALVTQQAAQTPGLENTQLAGADAAFTQDFVDAAGGTAEGMIMSGPDLEFAGSFYEETFKPKYTEISGEAQPIQVFHAHAFDAVNIVLAAIEEVGIEEGGTLYIPRTALRDAVLGTSGHEGITGTLTCTETGDCADPAISVSEVQDGEFVRIWP